MHPVQVDVDYVERRSRLTTFFRFILAIPHLIFAAIFGFVASIVGDHRLVRHHHHGPVPRGHVEPRGGFIRYYTRVSTRTASS